ncbi:nuclear transport factor 2 family protein [Acetobacteraceae bacterium]|nr:nuclear transport factor 2 family protein [Acetobacteraceae bacterium]
MKQNFPPLPPFTKENALQKVRMAENAWNSRNPEKVALAYTENSQWRNRDSFLSGRAEIIAFLTEKWQKEQDYKLIKSLWAFNSNKIAVRFAYEWRDKAGQYWRSYGNENWLFASNGQMSERHASINDVKINKNERKLLWEDKKRPDDFPSLSALGL